MKISSLVVFSNPSTTTRLRLDKEHRAIDVAVGASPDILVKRIHAATATDILHALRAHEFTIFQFSGHGSPSSIKVESIELEGGEVLSAGQISSILREAAPNLRVAIFMSCFSSSAIPTLVDCATYLITLTGPADDHAAVEFVAEFYSSYVRNQSVEHAFRIAILRAELVGGRSLLKAVLSRRAAKYPNRTLITVFPRGSKKDSVLVDLSETEADIAALGVQRDEFVALLIRKIEIHMWIFSAPRERALLPIGETTVEILHNAVRTRQSRRIAVPTRAVRAWPGLEITA